MFSETDLRDAIRRGSVKFTGVIRGDALLVSLGDLLQPFSPTATVVDPFSQESVEAGYAAPLDDWGIYDLTPGSTVLVKSAEEIALTSAVVGWLATLSHIARLGLAAHLASPVLSAHFEGPVCLELHNTAPYAIRLREGMAIAKIVISSMSSPSNPPRPDSGTALYAGRDLRSRYAFEFRDPLR